MSRELDFKSHSCGKRQARKPFVARLATLFTLTVLFLTAVVLGQPGHAFATGTTDAATSTVVASPTSVTANGTDTSTITVTLVDSSGNPETGHSVELGQSNSGHATIKVNGTIGNTATTNSSGQATFTVTDTTAQTVFFVATDTTDNVTVTQAASVDFIPGLTDAGTSTVAASPTSVTANGTDASTITVTLKDANGNVEPADIGVTLTASGGNSVISTGGTATTNSSGQATFTVTDTTAQTVTYTATDTTDNVTVTQTASVDFVAPTDAGTSTVAASPTTVVANGTDASTITVTLKDASGTPEPAGIGVTLTASGGNSVISTGGTATTNSSGQATFTVTDTTAQTVTYTATDTTDNVKVTQTASVDFADIGRTMLTASPAEVPANGTSYSTITGVVYDSAGNPLGGLPVVLVSPQAYEVFNGVTTDAGTFTWQVTGPGVGTYTYALEWGTSQQFWYGTSQNTLNSVQVTFVTPSNQPDPNLSEVQASPASVLADGISSSTIDVELVNYQGQPLSGKTVYLESKYLLEGNGYNESLVDGGVLSNGAGGYLPYVNPTYGTLITATTNADGVAAFTVTDTVPQTVTYQAVDKTDNVTLDQTATVTFVQSLLDVPGAGQSTVTASPTSVAANGTGTSTITVTLLNSQDSPVAGKTVSLVADSGSSSVATVEGTTNSSGQATFTVTDTQPETVTYQATDVTDNVTLDQTATVTFTQPAGTTPTPVIDLTLAGATSVSGTAADDAAIVLSAGGSAYHTLANATGAWTVAGLPALTAGETISVTAQVPGEAVSSPATTTVQATAVTTPAPVIDLPVAAGVTGVSGTAADDAAIVLGLNGSAYDTSANATGAWTVGGLPALTAGETISVTAQVPGEAVSSPATTTVVGDGLGTKNDPYLIGNATQLAAIQNTVGEQVYYQLTADINLAGVSWTPIGNPGTPFAGYFDGQGHVISNLTIDDTQGVFSTVGLFGTTAPGSVVENVGVRNVNINEIVPNSVAYAVWVGALVGQNQGIIKNTFSTGSVSENEAWSAGLVGQNDGSIADSYAVDNSAEIPGLVNWNNGSITDCYAISTREAVSPDSTGVMVRVNAGTITDSYVVGFGGWGGRFWVSPSGTVIDSYVTGPTPNNSTSGVTGGGAVTQPQMQEQATFTGWDFTHTWGINQGNYPYLRGVGPLPVVTVSAGPAAGGAVYGGGSYNVGDPVTVYASPAAGYTFTGWSDGSGNTVSTSVYYSFEVGVSDVVLVAHFTPGTPTTTASPTIELPVVAGATSVSGTAPAGASVVLSVDGTAQPAVTASANGAWTVSGLFPALAAGQTLAATAQTAGESVSVAQTATVVAQAQQTATPNIPPVFFRDTSVSGTAPAGASVILSVGGTVQPAVTVGANGDWTVSGLSLYAGETLSATAQAPGESVSLPFTTTVRSQTPAPVIDTPVTAGATSVSGTAAGNAAIALTVNGTVYDATATAAGAWTVDGLPALTAGETISVTAQVPGTAVSRIQTTTVVNPTQPQTPAPVLNTPLYAGSTGVSGTAADNAAITLSVNGTPYTATASANGLWSVSVPALSAGDVVSAAAQVAGEAASQTVTTAVVAASALTISPGAGSYTGPLTVTISDSSLSAGQTVYYSTEGPPESVTGAGSFTTSSHTLTLDSSATVYAQVYSGGEWGGIVSVAYQISTPTYTLTAQAAPAGEGTVTGGGVYASGASVALTATAASGYKFVNWTDAGGTVVGTNASFDYTMPDKNATLTANFTAATQDYTLTLAVSPSADGTATGGGSYPIGASVPLTATASSGYAFVDWTDAGGSVVSFSASFDYTMPDKNTTLTANFTTASPTSATIGGFAITNLSDQPVTGELTPGQQYLVSMTVQSTAATAQTPLFLIEAQQGGQVLAINSVQTQLAPNGSATVAVMFTPPAAGTVNLEFFAWSNWAGKPLAINKQSSVVVQ